MVAAVHVLVDVGSGVGAEVEVFRRLHAVEMVGELLRTEGSETAQVCLDVVLRLDVRRDDVRAGIPSHRTRSQLIHFVCEVCHLLLESQESVVSLLLWRLGVCTLCRLLGEHFLGELVGLGVAYDTPQVWLYGLGKQGGVESKLVIFVGRALMYALDGEHGVCLALVGVAATRYPRVQVVRRVTIVQVHIDHATERLFVGRTQVVRGKYVGERSIGHRDLE